MNDIFDNIATSISDSSEQEQHPFYHFEPWDVAQRPASIIEQAKKDGIYLEDGENLEHLGASPHKFQSGYLLSTHSNRYILGGSQIGKSLPAKIEVIIMASGEIPFSLRYPEGFDTGVKRLITKENIIRWGRFRSETGKFLDHNHKAKRNNDWNCGTIKGVGVYPSEKIAPPGSQLWIGTFSQAKNLYWWPSLGEQSTSIVPAKLIDSSKGNKGINKQEDRIHFIRDNEVIMLTYEMGHRRFEAQMAWASFLDEETPTKDIFFSAQEHARYRSMLFSPINGITWTKKLLYSHNADSVVYHATQYDSPYQDREELQKRISMMEPWYRASRVWGVPSEVKGAAFFDRKKISVWRQRFKYPFKIKSFQPSREYASIVTNAGVYTQSGLMDISVRADEEAEHNRRTTWTVYEDRIPNTAYILGADPADGNPNPDNAGDVCAAGIMRPPMGLEKEPVIVATMRSTAETIPFARVCAQAARYYNNATLAAETKRGFANASFAAELRDWPFWYKHTSIQDSTGKPRQQFGFDTNASTRESIFELIRDRINSYDIDEYPYIQDEALLKELEQAVVSFTSAGKRRCDHTNEGTLDSAIWFGICLYIFKNARDQIRCNMTERTTGEEDSKARFWTDKSRAKIACGMSAFGYKESK